MSPLKAAPSETRVLLLVEDNPADADLVEEMLEQAGGEHYRILRAGLMADAVQVLSDNHVDVVLLDLRLPDSSGVETLKSLRNVSSQIPIVVLTGTDDEALAMSCIDAGAQDYLCKGEIRPCALRRAIGYAVTRLRELQLRELQETLERYRSLTSVATVTSVTAALAGTGAVRDRHPHAFAALIRDYRDLLECYMDFFIVKRDRPRDVMERIVTRLGDAGGGPRDLLDLHVAALDEIVSGKTTERGRSLVLQGRLLALELMGLLVDYYRVGQRRRSE